MKERAKWLMPLLRPSLKKNSSRKNRMAIDIERLFGRAAPDKGIPPEEYRFQNMNTSGLGEVLSPTDEVRGPITYQDVDNIRASAGNAEQGMYVLGQHIAKLEDRVEALERAMSTMRLVEDLRS